ncbi:hypothetical protein EI94DRAFT_387558 [Lactarius quietus]|nr:hypothetical protein EI94DRAFT_387558 [Lactarius quietus]
MLMVVGLLCLRHSSPTIRCMTACHAPDGWMAGGTGWDTIKARDTADDVIPVAKRRERGLSPCSPCRCRRENLATTLDSELELRLHAIICPL